MVFFILFSFLSFRKKQIRTRQMAPWVKDVLYKHADVSDLWLLFGTFVACSFKKEICTSLTFPVSWVVEAVSCGGSVYIGSDGGTPAAPVLGRQRKEDPGRSLSSQSWNIHEPQIQGEALKNNIKSNRERYSKSTSDINIYTHTMIIRYNNQLYFLKLYGLASSWWRLSKKNKQKRRK